MLNFHVTEWVPTTYQINDTLTSFQIYQSNNTEHFMYQVSPLEKIKYQTDYKQSSHLEEMDRTELNKIKYWISETEKSEDINDKYYFYVNIQLLIWKLFHPDIEVEMVGNKELVEKYYDKLLLLLPNPPNWVHDYEMQEEIILEVSDQYEIISNQCEVEKNENQIILTKCEDNAKIEVKEKGEDTILALEDKTGELKVLEGGNFPWTWEFQILPSKRPEIPEEKPNPPIKEEEEKPNSQPEEKPEDSNDNLNSDKIDKSENLPNQSEYEEEKRVITNVPNTYQSSFEILWLFLFLLGIYQWKK